MFAIHFLNIANREYTLKILREKQDAGYVLKAVKAGLIFTFEKSDEKYDYTIHAITGSVMKTISKGDIEDFNEMAKSAGWTAMNKGHVVVYRKPMGALSENIFDSVEEEKTVASKFVKGSIYNLIIPGIISIFSLFTNSLNLMYINTQGADFIFHLFLALAMLFNAVFVSCNLVFNWKFINVNKTLPDDEIKYFDSKNLVFFNSILLPLAIIFMIVSIVALFSRITKSEYIVNIVLAMFTPLVFGLIAGSVLGNFILTNAKYSKKKKVIISLLALIIVLMMSNFIVFSMIF